jgi:hypothetical protein
VETFRLVGKAKGTQTIHYHNEYDDYASSKQDSTVTYSIGGNTVKVVEHWVTTEESFDYNVTFTLSEGITDVINKSAGSCFIVPEGTRITVQGGGSEAYITATQSFLYGELTMTESYGAVWYNYAGMESYGISFKVE